MNPNDPNKIDLSNARIAAEASSEGDGGDRWTRLRVYFLADFRRPWIAEACGCSSLPGEVQKRRVMASASLERALRLFDDSDLGIVVKESAREWADEECEPTMPPQAAPMDDQEALTLLFGVPVQDMFLARAAAALGIADSTLRMALKKETEVRVPLMAILPFIDRAAFQRAQAGDRNRG